MAAGIAPGAVQSSVNYERNTSSYGWGLVNKIEAILLNNLGEGHLDPEPTSISYWPRGGGLLSDYYEQKITDFDCIVSALKEKGAPDSATFKAESLWPWMAKNVAEELGFDPDLYEYLAETYLEDNSTKAESTGLPLPSGVRSSERERDLAEQVAALSKRVQQVEEENAVLRAKTPTIRHLTQMIALVLQVQERYWGDNWDPDIPDSYPKQNDIIEWLMGAPHCCTERQAKAIEIIARAAHRRGKL